MIKKRTLINVPLDIIRNKTNWIQKGRLYGIKALFYNFINLKLLFLNMIKCTYFWTFNIKYLQMINKQLFLSIIFLFAYFKILSTFNRFGIIFYFIFVGLNFMEFTNSADGRKYFCVCKNNLTHFVSKGKNISSRFTIIVNVFLVVLVKNCPSVLQFTVWIWCCL